MRAVVGLLGQINGIGEYTGPVPLALGASLEVGHNGWSGGRLDLRELVVNDLGEVFQFVWTSQASENSLDFVLVDRGINRAGGLGYWQMEACCRHCSSH